MNNLCYKDQLDRTISAIVEMNTLNKSINNDEINNIYNKLFEKINNKNTKKYEQKIILMWIDYLTDNIKNLNNIIYECQEFTSIMEANTVESNKILDISNN
jgi:hypothetical protein